MPPQDNQIVVSPGSKYGLFLLLQAVVDPGDEVIVPLPYWVSYPEMVKFCGGRVVYADHLQPDKLFELTAASYISKCSAQDQGRDRQFAFQSHRQDHEQRRTGETDRLFLQKKYPGHR